MTTETLGVENKESIRYCPACGAEAPTGTTCVLCGSELDRAADSPASHRTHQKKDVTKLTPDAALLERLVHEPGEAPAVRPVTLALALAGTFVAALIIFFIARTEEVFAPDSQQHGQAELPTVDSVKVNGKRLAAKPQIDSLLQVLSRNSTDAKARLQLADWYYYSELWREARDEYSIYLKGDPKNVQARMDYAFTIANAEGDMDRAMQEIEQAISYDPNNFAALFNAGLLALRTTGEEHVPQIAKARGFFTRARKAALKEEPGMVEQIDKILAEMDAVEKAKAESPASATRSTDAHEHQESEAGRP